MNSQVLHERQTQDLHVLLVWNADEDSVYVVVRDRNTSGHFVIETDRADALDAFYHPFCYPAAVEVVGELALSSPA